MKQYQPNRPGLPNTDYLQGGSLQSRMAGYTATVGAPLAGTLSGGQVTLGVGLRHRPRIGVISSSGCMRDGGWPVYTGDAATVNALFEAGGYPIIIPTLPLIQGYDPFNILTDDDAFEEVFSVIWPMIHNLDGLLLAGGGDMYSCLYGHVVHPQTGTPELWRDIWERYFALIAWVLCIPTLGICRGMQVMNVVRGGGLFQDVRSQWPKNMPPLVPHRARGRITADNWVEHPITIHPKSRLARIMRGREERIPYRQYIDAVLSMHHQIIGYLTPGAEIVGYLAPGLAVGATAPDGVIEAIEDCDPQRYWVAVQFHPEWMVHLSWALRLFTSLIDASSAYAALPHELTDSFFDEVRGWVRLSDAHLTQLHTGIPTITTKALSHGPEAGARSARTGTLSGGLATINRAPTTGALIPFSIEESV